MQQGLIKTTGDGTDTNVWIDNWIMDVIPQTPRYRQGANIDLTMKVSDFINLHTGLWETETIRQFVAIEDMAHILSIKTSRMGADSTIWCFSKDGAYSSKSGYRFLETLHRLHYGQPQGIPPIEKVSGPEFEK